MKRLKALTLIAVCASLISVCACGSSSEDAGAAAQETEETSDLEATLNMNRDIKTYIEDNTPADLNPLLASDWLTVYVGSDSVDVTIRTLFDYAIPYVAEDMIPVAQEALEESGATLGTFTVNSYEEDSSGTISGTLTNWHTSDWESGIFVSAADGTTISNETIDDLLEYYADYEDLIQSLKGSASE